MWSKVTGTNDVPLGNRRRFGPAPAESNAPVQLAQPSPSAFPRPRHVEQEQPREDYQQSIPAAPVDPNAPRKRRSRWGDSKVEIPGLPTAISADGVSQAQLDNYAIQVRLEEINKKLRLNDYIPAENERSPSPPPTYDAQGRRTNTREVRYRKKLEEERIKLVDKALKTDPNFRPPVEYHQQKRNMRPQDKVYIPVKEFPEINFFGLLVGPRGNSLKKMEKDSGAKISIRGKGSVKEGKSRPDAFADDSEEDLHCLIMAETDEKVAACVNMINRVIETAASTPEGQNDHKRNQLRELAALNGTLRDDENQVCQNCGDVGHRKYDCPEQRNFTANVICRICGSAGHMARDCTANKRDPNLPPGMEPPPSALSMDRNDGSLMVKTGGFDSEYERLMNELGEGGGGGGGGGGAAGFGGGAGHDITGSGLNVPPWRRPDVWAPPVAPPVQNQNQGYRPPQAGYGFGSSMWAQAGFSQYGAQEQQQPQDYYAQYYSQYQQYPQGYPQHA